MQRNTAQKKEQTKNTEVQIWRGKRKITWKRIQHNDSKDDQKPWKQNGKMQESINKDLEGLKNKHTETNNTSTEIKTTLERINSRISEGEERISELEDKMTEITSEEQNKVKRMKRAEESLRDLWDFDIWPYQMHQHLNYRGRRKKKEKSKGYEKNFEQIIVENFPNM